MSKDQPRLISLPVCPDFPNLLVRSDGEDNQEVTNNGKKSDEVDENTPEADRSIVHGNER